jgi:hypothetical protein
MLRKARYKSGVNATKHTSLLIKNSSQPANSGSGNNNNEKDDDEFI